MHNGLFEKPPPPDYAGLLSDFPMHPEFSWMEGHEDGKGFSSRKWAGIVEKLVVNPPEPPAYLLVVLARVIGLNDPFFRFCSFITGHHPRTYSRMYHVYSEKTYKLVARDDMHLLKSTLGDFSIVEVIYLKEAGELAGAIEITKHKSPEETEE